jgi:p-cumate 2,3-dioxygenase ferredoxin component
LLRRSGVRRLFRHLRIAQKNYLQFEVIAKYKYLLPRDHRMDIIDPSLVFICRVGDVPDGQIRRFDINDHAIACANVGGLFYAFEDRCTHGEASLSEDGQLIGHTVECGWHCGQFDIRSGEAIAAPCTDALRIFAVVQQDESLFVKASEVAASSA